MILKLITLFILSSVYSANSVSGLIDLEVVDSNTISRIQKDGYKVEEHKVQTTDGYILTMHRIPFLNSTKPPIYLQHGFVESSSCWILSGPGKGLAYILSDAGYDVWMGNNRGNKYSKEHAWLDIDSTDYWNFSWHELGLFDVSAMTDYILNKTDRTALQYIGHSQGTTSFFVLNSIRTEYNDKFISMHAFAPVAFMDHSESALIVFLAPFIGYPNFLVELTGSKEFLPSSKLRNALGYVLCQDGSLVQAICTNIIFAITGYDIQNLNTSMLPDIVATVPAGSSINQAIHFTQVYNSGKFRRFDYGLRNYIEYGTWEPPDYELDKISAPIALYHGNNDWLAEPEDVQRLEPLLKSLKISYRVPHDPWNHLDFVYGVNAKESLYDKVLQDLEYFQNSNN